MEPKEQRSQEMRGVIAVVAIVLALMGFSAALATKGKPEAGTATQAPSVASTYVDPSLAGLHVADDAEVDTTVEFHN
jgi:hypothetical protein